MATHEQQIIYKAYAAFNNRDIDTVLALLQPQVQWPNGWEGGYVQGQDAVRAYWTRQWQAIDPHVTPISITEKTDGRQEVRVHQVVKDKQGTLLADGYVLHIYTFENGLVKKMEIDPS